MTSSSATARRNNGEDRRAAGRGDWEESEAGKKARKWEDLDGRLGNAKRLIPLEGFFVCWLCVEEERIPAECQSRIFFPFWDDARAAL